MVTHVVMWKVKGSNPDEKQQNLRAILDTLYTLQGKIPGLLTLEAGENIPKNPAAWDVVLRTQHPTWEALNEYRVHPVHHDAASIIGALTVDRAVVDWEG
jgi:hypothetical protein